MCIDEAKVAVVPGEAFGAPGYFRMSYALGDEDLVEGVRPPGRCSPRPESDSRSPADRCQQGGGR